MYDDTSSPPPIIRNRPNPTTKQSLLKTISRIVVQCTHTPGAIRHSLITVVFLPRIFFLRRSFSSCHLYRRNTPPSNAGRKDVLRIKGLYECYPETTNCIRSETLRGHRVIFKIVAHVLWVYCTLYFNPTPGKNRFGRNHGTGRE